MGVLLTLLNVAVAALVAFFTWRLVVATEKMGETQAKQAKILERQTEVLAGQAKLQEGLAEIQERLARADGTPLLYLKRVPTSEGGIEFKNLGKYGIEVVGVYHNTSMPDSPLQGGSPIQLHPFTFPAGVAPLESLQSNFQGGQENTFFGRTWFEVLYRHGVGGELLSDLWEIPEGEYAFRRVPGWHARRVLEAEV